VGFINIQNVMPLCKNVKPPIENFLATVLVSPQYVSLKGKLRRKVNVVVLECCEKIVCLVAEITDIIIQAKCSGNIKWRG